METLGKYQILEKIGEGGMGRVYKAGDTVLNRKVAIKVISIIAASEPDKIHEMHERFMREARLVGSMHHPNIVTLFDFGEIDETLYMVMELLDGTDLKTIIQNKTEMPFFRMIDLFRQVCEGLAYAHSHDVIHRDLKPGNIHLLSNGTVKLVDFGLARARDSNLTASGMVVGTPFYMSPEQIRGHKVDGRSDLFSLGSVIYELLTGRHPFTGETTTSLLANILTTDPPAIRSIVPTVPFQLDAIVRKCLSKSIETRFQNAREIIAALNNPDIMSEMVSHEASTKQLAAVKSSSADDKSIKLPQKAPFSPPSSPSTPSLLVQQKKRSSLVTWSALTLIVVVAIGIAITRLRYRPPSQSPPSHYEEVQQPKMVINKDQVDAPSEQPALTESKETIVRTEPANSSGVVPQDQTHSENPDILSSPQTAPVQLTTRQPVQSHSSDTSMNGIGSLHVRITNLPSTDMSLVLTIDGDGVATDNPSDFQLDLSAGRHSIAIQCQGFEPYKKEVLVTVGQSTSVDITLTQPIAR